MDEILTITPSLGTAKLPLFELMKGETAHLHKLIEFAIPLLKSDLTLAEYRTHLVTMLGFYLPLEVRLEQFAHEFGDVLNIAHRFKRMWIQSDLIALDVSAADLGQSLKCASITKISSLPQCVGILYVIEGSTLGAQVIKQSLIRYLDLDESKMHFYNGYGKETLSMWSLFRLQAQTAIERCDYNESAASARDTFQLLLEWLQAR